MHFFAKIGKNAQNVSKQRKPGFYINNYTNGCYIIVYIVREVFRGIYIVRIHTPVQNNCHKWRIGAEAACSPVGVKVGSAGAGWPLVNLKSVVFSTSGCTRSLLATGTPRCAFFARIFSFLPTSARPWPAAQNGIQV